MPISKGDVLTMLLPEYVNTVPGEGTGKVGCSITESVQTPSDVALIIEK